MKNILVIGGSYFVGRVFVLEMLEKKEYAIHLMNRGNNPFNRPEIAEHFCDRHDVSALKQVVPPLDWHAVIDFCGYEPAEVEIILNNLPGTINHYIYISTCSVYESSDDLPKFEDSPKLLGPIAGPFGDYGYKKWLTEVKLVNQGQEKGIPYTILRPAFIYGQFNYAPRESFFFDLILTNKPIPIPDNTLALFQFVFVRDVAKICLACLGNEKVYHQAYNLAAEEFISYKKLIKVLEEISDKRLWTKKLSVTEINRNNIPLPFPLDKHELYAGSLIANTLNFTYTPFAKGLKETFEFYKKYVFPAKETN
ncbi:MAG: NAD-dependent epimerase/dehydratase family protein [Peptococcaceae bacterium]